MPIRKSSQGPKPLLRQASTLAMLKAGIYLGGAQTMRVLVKAIYVVVLAKFLGPELFGLYNFGLSWYLAFMSLTFMGMDLILSREVNQQFAQNDQFIAATLKLQLIASSLAALLSVLISLLLDDPKISLVLGIFSLALLGRSVSAWASFVFTAWGVSNRVFWMESTCRISEAVAGCVVLILGGGLLEIVVIHTIFWWIQAAWGLGELSAARLLRVSCNVRDAILTLGGAPIILGIAGVAQVWLAQGPLLLFRLLGGHPVTLGQVALALQIFGLLAAMSWAVCRAALPELSKSVKEQRSGDTRFATLFGQATIFGMGMLTAVAYVFGSPLLELLVGREYTVAGMYIPYVVALSVAYILAVGGHQILASHGAYIEILLGTVAGAVALTGTMVIIWEWSPQNTPFISLGVGLLIWLLLIGKSVYARTRFSLARVIAIPLGISIIGILLARVLLPFNGPIALIAALAWFLPWVWRITVAKI